MSDEWRSEGACRTVSPDVFYPSRGEDTGPAKAVCAACPVLAECRDYGIRHELHGTWGGLSEKQRRAERRRLGIPLEAPSSNPFDGWKSSLPKSIVSQNKRLRNRMERAS